MMLHECQRSFQYMESFFYLNTAGGKPSFLTWNLPTWARPTHLEV